jgi:hypothetical protein
MDEHEFDALFPYRPFDTKEATQEDARLRRCSTLASALFGTTPEDLQQQLLAPHPKIPPGFSLNDFRDLKQHTGKLLAIDPTVPRLARFSLFQQMTSRTIAFGIQRYSTFEAQYKIVCCAIEFLENRS